MPEGHGGMPVQARSDSESQAPAADSEEARARAAVAHISDDAGAVTARIPSCPRVQVLQLLGLLLLIKNYPHQLAIRPDHLGSFQVGTEFSITGRAR